MNAKKALKAVAHQKDTTVDAIRAEIQEAITLAWTNSSESTALLQQKVPSTGQIPTPEELLEYLFIQLLIDCDHNDSCF